MLWVIKFLNWLIWPIAALMRQLAAVKDEIQNARQPTDGVGAHVAPTIVLINPDFLDAWQSHIPDEAIKRFGHPRGWMKVVASEVDLQDKPYKLDARELAAYRRGVPIIKKTVPFKKRTDLKRGGRPLDDAEHRLREALGYQVYIRTEQARGLLERQAAHRDNYQVPEAREAVWRRLAERVGFDRKNDLPRLKLRAQDGDSKLTKEERAKLRRQRTFEALFTEGAKLATKHVSGTEAPRDVSRLALKSGRDMAASDVTAEMEGILTQVVVLYRVYVSLARKVSFLYRFWSWLRGGTPARRNKQRGRRRPREMRAGQHRVLATGNFKPSELLLVACHADVNPLLIDPQQFGCTREFEIARKLGRFCRGSDERLSGEEIDALRDIMPARDAGTRSEYDAMRDDLRQLSLEILPLQQWEEILTGAAEARAEITLSYRRGGLKGS